MTPTSAPPSSPASRRMDRPDADPPGALRIESATREDVERIASFQERMSLETEDRVLDAATIRRGVAHVFDNPAAGLSADLAFTFQSRVAFTF